MKELIKAEVIIDAIYTCLCETLLKDSNIRKYVTIENNKVHISDIDKNTFCAINGTGQYTYIPTVKQARNIFISYYSIFDNNDIIDISCLTYDERMFHHINN